MFTEDSSNVKLIDVSSSDPSVPVLFSILALLAVPVLGKDVQNKSYQKSPPPLGKKCMISLYCFFIKLFTISSTPQRVAATEVFQAFL